MLQEEECHESPSSWTTWCSVSDRKITWSHLLKRSVWEVDIVEESQKPFMKNMKLAWQHFQYGLATEWSFFDWANSVVQRMKTQSSIKYMYNQWSQFYHNECRNRLWNFREQDSRSMMMALQRLASKWNLTKMSA